MKCSRIANFILAGLVGFATAAPSTTVLADDTEIYLGANEDQEGVRPNVVFVLDTSGSMSGNVEGTGKDRLDNMKDAFKLIMNSASNINVGLMRFTDPGGPVLWPVSYIDEDVAKIESGGATGVAVNVRVSEANDDAEERDAVPGGTFQAGAVDLTDLDLDLITEAGGGGVPTTVTPADDPGLRVIDQSNNAEQSGNDIITQNQIDMDSNQTNGVRFNSVPVPPGATVTDARIVFTARTGDSSTATFLVEGEDSINPATFPTSCGGCANVTARARTNANVTWIPPAWSAEDKGANTTTENLKDIVQEIIDKGGWASGNPMVFIINPSTSGGHRGAYTFAGSGTTASRRAELQVTFTTGVGAATGQIVGMRFQDVPIPQGVSIKSAVIEFFPSAAPTLPTTLSISGELSGDAAAFSNTTGDLSGRPKSAPVTWTQTSGWGDVNSPEQTVDISAVVQAIVNQGSWCGNNALALFVSSGAVAADGPLLAESFDSDPSRAPILRVDFDQGAVPATACINSIVQSQVFVSSDDAEETISTGSISLTGSEIDMNSNQINGFRFASLPITQGATVLDARLTLVSRQIDTNASVLTFKAEASDNAETFTSTNSDISSRPTTAASVSWNVPDFDVVGIAHQSVDLTPIIQEVINRGGWEAFNSLVIIQSHTSGDDREARSFNDNPGDAPRLTIQVQGAGATAAITVRQKLKEIVDNFDHEGFTPIVDTLYEAAKYLRGESVLWGKQRGFANGNNATEGTTGQPSGDPACDSAGACNSSGSANNTVRANTRTSHPGSFTGGSISRPAGCTLENLNAGACRGEVVTGSPVYTSPITESCQATYIVLLSDGQANHNDSPAFIKSDYGIACAGSNTGDETCGPELAKFLFEEDQSSLAGDQLISTYTIGFALDGDPGFLQSVASNGGGAFFSAGNAAELANVFQEILVDILSRSTSFATPSLSVNAFNKLFDLDDVYFSFFIPDTRVRWKGNVKRYGICVDTADGCVLGSVLDSTGTDAIDPTTQRISDSAKSFWSAVTDGSEIELGGAASQVPSAATRKVFTFTDLTSPVVNPINASLDDAVHELEDSNDDGILDGLVGHPDHPDPELDTKILLGDPTGLLSAAQRAALIDWIRGRDVDDEDEDGDTAENRFNFADPLHSSPIAVTFGGDEDNPVIKLFVGTNDGGFKMINAENGLEEWVVYPQQLLALQQTLRTNNNGEHLYGLDGVPTPWIFDANQDGVIDPAAGDFVRIIVGQRRGGNNLFAFDVTPDTVLTDPAGSGDIFPELLWKISGNDTEFPNLGQTWSRPIVTQVRFGEAAVGVSTLRDVVAIAGGYDVTQDDGFFGPSSPGNAIYLIDALTGERLFSISSDDPGLGDHLVIADMNCPIPADLILFDSDGDGGDDRIYVGDACGQVWRVDFAPDLSATAGIKVVVGKFAELSDPVNVEDQRKVFFRADVAQVLNTEFTTVSRYDLVIIVTGLRNNPLNLDVEDKAYALRDFHVDPLTDVDDDGEVDFGTYTTIQGPVTGDVGTLFDATSVVEDPEDVDLVALQTADGWFINLTQNGEKALASPIILAGKLFFTTYLPEGVVDASTCALAEGSGLLYGVNVLTGGVVFNWDDADGTDTLTISDKSYALGTGIPSSAVPIFQEEGITLLIGGGGGATTIDPDIELPRGRTFWYQQED